MNNRRTNLILKILAVVFVPADDAISYYEFKEIFEL